MSAPVIHFSEKILVKEVECVERKENPPTLWSAIRVSAKVLNACMELTGRFENEMSDFMSHTRLPFRRVRSIRLRSP